MQGIGITTPHTTGKDFAAMRLRNFGVSIIVMVVCFTLHYMGLFGGVEGPLEGKRLGETLVTIGFTKYHLLGCFLALLVVSVTWNWIFNYVAKLRGTRLTCIRISDEDGFKKVCGAPARRTETQKGRDGKTEYRYRCAHGHVLRQAKFHPIKKTAITHTIWMIVATWCGMLVYFIW